jgi:putative component of membrane protein insertase Oxa1/YidC/SpoIIIJ protein YidD
LPLLWLIKLYWWVWPSAHRRQCLFRVSCSRHVYLRTRRHGLMAGIQALQLRTQQCRPGAYAFHHPITGQWLLQLADGTQIPATEAARQVC